MWKEISLDEFVHLRQSYSVAVKAGLTVAGGDFVEWAEHKLAPAMLRWDSYPTDESRWWKWDNNRKGG